MLYKSKDILNCTNPECVQFSNLELVMYILGWFDGSKALSMWEYKGSHVHKISNVNAWMKSGQPKLHNMLKYLNTLQILCTYKYIMYHIYHEKLNIIVIRKSIPLIILIKKGGISSCTVM